jgi:UTP--glucose-1-phosphate uridylyltransferase
MRAEVGCLTGMVELYGKCRRQHRRGRRMRSGDWPTNTASSARAKTLDGGFRITEMVEKPAKGTAPSNYFINGRYILQPEIFDILANQERGAGNEIQVTDAMLKLAESQPFSAYTSSAVKPMIAAPRMGSSWPMWPSRSTGRI